MKTGRKSCHSGEKRQRMVVTSVWRFWRWLLWQSNVRTVVYGYYDSFVRRGVDVDTAASHLQALAQPVGDAQLEELQAEWDSWRYSRLRESVTTEAQDGTELHGYLYDEGSDVTAIYLPRFHGTGLDDFLMGPWLNAETGCNILMLDPRAHGESGGDYFSYGWKESEDLACWLDWADETLGEQTFLLCGEGCRRQHDFVCRRLREPGRQGGLRCGREPLRLIPGRSRPYPVGQFPAPVLPIPEFDGVEAESGRVRLYQRGTGAVCGPVWASVLPAGIVPDLSGGRLHSAGADPGGL